MTWWPMRWPRRPGGLGDGLGGMAAKKILAQVARKISNHFSGTFPGQIR